MLCAEFQPCFTCATAIEAGSIGPASNLLSGMISLLCLMVPDKLMFRKPIVESIDLSWAIQNALFSCGY